MMMKRVSNNNKERRRRRRRRGSKFLLYFSLIPLIYSFLSTYTRTSRTSMPNNNVINFDDNTIIIDKPTTREETSSSSTTTTSDTTTSISSNNNNNDGNENDNDNNININDNNNNNNNIVIIAAGLGTTGTHLIYKATCYLGYKSVHYNLGCIDSSYTSAMNLTNKTTDDSLSSLIKQPFNIHKELLTKISTLSRCLQSTSQQLCGNAILWKQAVENIIDELVVDTTNLVAFHDNPYPYFVDSFVKVVAKKHSKTPIVLLSERSPSEWLKRRIETKHISGDIMCKNSVLMSDNSTTGTSSKTLSSGFDLLGCINDAINNKNNNNNNNLDLKDILISLKHISKNPNFRKIMNINGAFPRIIIPQPSIVSEIQRYQDHVRGQLSNFTYDMFTQENKTSVSTLADMILNEIPMLRKDQSNPNNHNQTTKVTHVNWWKGTVDGASIK